MRNDFPISMESSEWLIKIIYWYLSVKLLTCNVLVLIFTCFNVAIYLVIYSNVTGSSTVSLWLWHSILARLIRILASAVSPEWTCSIRSQGKRSLKMSFLESGRKWVFIFVYLDSIKNIKLLPAKAKHTWLSSKHIFLTVLGSWSLGTAFLSTANTTKSLPRTPTYEHKTWWACL